VYECYLSYDRDGDGIAERLRVILASDYTLLAAEEYDSVAIVLGVATRYPHRWQGISLFDRIRDIQDSNTSLIRSIEDGVALAARQRIGAVDNRVNLEDLLTSTTGGIVRMSAPDAVLPIPNPDVPQSAFTLLQQNNERRHTSGGSAIQGSSQQMAVSGDSAHGVERMMSALELDNAQVAKTFAETFIRPIYIELHRLLRKFAQGEIQTRTADGWMSSAPQSWMERTRATLRLTPSQGERLRRAQALAQIHQQQLALRQMGSIVVNDSSIFQVVYDQADLLNLPNPHEYFINPKSQEGQQAAQWQQQWQQQQQAQQQQLQELQQKLAAVQAEAQVRVARAQEAKVALDAENDRLREQIKAMEAAEKSSLERDKLAQTSALKLLEMEQAAQADLNNEFEDNRNAAS